MVMSFSCRILQCGPPQVLNSKGLQLDFILANTFTERTAVMRFKGMLRAFGDLLTSGPYTVANRQVFAGYEQEDLTPCPVQ
jgi:hypothetical protein